MDRTKLINWEPAAFLIIYQVALMIGLPFYFYYNGFSTSMFVLSIVLLYVTGISITGGYHRYFSHPTYKTNRVIEAILLFFGSMAAQGSALRWSYDHRLHHAHVDTDDDPYSIKKGFWYAHCLWLLEKPRTIEPKLVSDLMRNPLVMFQHRYSKLLMVFTNVIVWALIGWMMNDYLGAFVLATGLRMFLLHHFTWFINSLAHTWGDKPFSEEQSAVDNYVISFVTFGEGYHNYHHTFANDYRNGIRWYHFDPTKWIIWTLDKLGLAHGLRRMDSYSIKKRMVLERKNILLERIKEVWYVKKDELEQKIQEMSDTVLEHASEFKKLKEKYRDLKARHCPKELIKELRDEMRALKKTIQQDWRKWSELSRHIMCLQPLEV